VELQGKTDYEWLTEKTAKHLTDSDRDVLETGRSSEVVETIPAPDGKPRTWMVFKFPVRDASGRKFLGAVAIDVTERQLLEEQLRQSQKMEAVGKLAAGVAHDFNNLLTVMQGYSELIVHRNSSMEVVRGQVGEIHKAAIRAGRLTRQLLAFTRQEVVQPKVLDLNGVVTDMHKMLKRLIGADVEFSFLPGTGLGRVKADPGQIEQIVMNLVVNARDAMPKGGKLIVETGNAEMDVSHALSRPGLRPGPYVLLAVTDTGMGMDAETRSRIFEPFFTTKDPGKGTGLGLATVYGIVKQCEGDVQVYSEPGQGATFKIYIPRVQDAAETGRSSTASEGLPEGSETVLLVDNERPVAAMVRATLESLGYTVIEAHNGPEALEAAGRHPGPIHLVMTDMVMPQMNGPEFAARFAGSHPGVPILYMSGYAEKAIIHQGLMDPNASFLAKPFGPATLAHRVREVLDPERRLAA
jgi:two-component system cell cycle sensor histidine kinase/response regulator CckA